MMEEGVLVEGVSLQVLNPAWFLRCRGSAIFEFFPVYGGAAGFRNETDRILPE